MFVEIKILECHYIFCVVRKVRKIVGVAAPCSFVSVNQFSQWLIKAYAWLDYSSLIIWLKPCLIYTAHPLAKATGNEFFYHYRPIYGPDKNK